MNKYIVFVKTSFGPFESDPMSEEQAHDLKSGIGDPKVGHVYFSVKGDTFVLPSAVVNDSIFIFRQVKE